MNKTRTALGVLSLLVAIAAAGCGGRDRSTGGSDGSVAGGTLPVTDKDIGPFEVSIGGVIARDIPTEQLDQFDIDSGAMTTPSSTTTPSNATIPSSTTTTSDATTSTTPPEPPIPCHAFAVTGPTFETDSPVLTASGRRVVDAIVEEIRAAPCGRDVNAQQCDAASFEAWIFGHTDERPSDRPGGNVQLSIDRATAVAEVASAAHLIVAHVEGLAATRPATPPTPDNRTDEQRYQDDRRTEIVVVCKP